MKTSTLLMTTMLSTGFLLGAVPSVHAATITADTVTTAAAPIPATAIADPRVAAEAFIAHVNYARVALAMNNKELAQQHIVQARAMNAIVTNALTEQRHVAHVEAGRVVYTFDTEHKYNYFPIDVSAVEIKEVSDGPLWAKNSLAVTDAEFVYLTLDLSNDKAESYLAGAEVAIAAGNLNEAQVKLGALTDAVVTIDAKVAVPLDKARDNIGIAQNFVRAKNYDGARYALAHADEALDAMRQDDAFKTQRPAIIAMRQEITELRDITTRKDPTLLQKTGAQLDKWMKEVKSWASK
jgi:hypothetical protein